MILEMLKEKMLHANIRIRQCCAAVALTLKSSALPGSLGDMVV